MTHAEEQRAKRRARAGLTISTVQALQLFDLLSEARAAVHRVEQERDEALKACDDHADMHDELRASEKRLAERAEQAESRTRSAEKLLGEAADLVDTPCGEDDEPHGMTCAWRGSKVYHDPGCGREDADGIRELVAARTALHQDAEEGARGSATRKDADTAADPPDGQAPAPPSVSPTPSDYARDLKAIEGLVSRAGKEQQRAIEAESRTRALREAANEVVAEATLGSCRYCGRLGGHQPVCVIGKLASTALHQDAEGVVCGTCKGKRAVADRKLDPSKYPDHIGPCPDCVVREPAVREESDDA